MSSGYKTARDFHVGTKMAWMGTTKVVDNPGAEHFPDIVKAPLAFVPPNGVPQEWTGMWVPISIDDGLPVGVASSDTYTLWTPKEVLAYAQECLAGTDAKLSSLGMIFDRSHFFLNFELPELSAIVRPGHLFHFMIRSGLDKGTSPLGVFSSTETVCYNTERKAIREGETIFAGRLSKNFVARAELAKKAIENVVGVARFWNETMDSLQKTPVKKDDVVSAFRGEIAGKGATLTSTKATNIVDGLVSLYEGGTKGGSVGNNWLQIKRSFTEYFGQGIEADSKRDAFDRWQSSEFGGFAKRKDEFCDTISTSEGRDSIVKIGRDAWKRDVAKAKKAALALV
jgi:hypothetical protein